MSKNKERNLRSLMSDTKFYSDYSRWNDEEGRYETWEEAVTRVMNMHRTYYKEKLSPELSNAIDEAEALYKLKYALGAQRALQFGGDQILKKHMKMYNCLSTHADRPAFFQEIFWTLLCGSGVGFSVQKHHIEKMPKIQERKKQAKGYIVPDSIEGWADSVGVLMSSYFVGGGTFPEFEGRKVYFDLTKIRPKGAMISGGFKAPGPEPLRRALDRIEYMLQGIVLSGRDYLKPIEVYDIAMHISNAVLSGGVRRSATICLFSPDDEEMMNAKTGNWFIENPQRGRSNNSAVIVRNEITREEFSKIMERIHEHGEPGFYFVSNKDHTSNPCFTGDTKVAVADGRNAVDIKKLAEENTPFPVYSAHLGPKNKWVTDVQTAIAFKTGTRNTIRVTLSDGTSFRCTPEHKLMAPDGSHVLAKDSLGKELEGFFTTNEVKKQYRRINSFTNAYRNQHRMVWEYHNGTIDKGFVIDHIESGTPDFIDNLQLLSRDEHDKKTGLERRGKNNPVFRIEDTKKWKQNLSNKAFLENNPRFLGLSNEEIIENAKLLHKMGQKISFENLIKMDDRMPKSFSKNRFGGSIHNLRAIVVGDVEYVEPKQAEYIENDYNECSYINPTVVAIEEAEVEDVYDLKVENNSNFYILTQGDENYINSTGILVHNCVEIGMYPKLGDESGFQGCNLTEINGSKCTSKEEFFKACRAASILGTLQAGYTKFDYLPETTQKIFEREALLGVSITGWMNSPDVLFDPEIQKQGAKIVRETNEEIASLIGINPAARTTCVKPSGNASVLLKTASGIHAEHAPRYIRNVQLNKEKEIAQLLAETNPYMVEESVWSEGKTDYIISFPVISPEGSIYKDEVFGTNLLEKVKLVQQNWVEAGTNIERCVHESLRHNVSNTVTVRQDQWKEVEQFVYDNMEYFSGIAFLSNSGDKDYNQAPMTEVLTETQIVEKYGKAALFASGLIVDTHKGFTDLWEAVMIAKNTEEGSGELSDIRADWIRRFRKFAKNYFNGDLKKAEYCLKDVALLHKWTKIQQNYRSVDFVSELQVQKYVDVDTLGSEACSGGVCDISVDF